MKNVKFKIVVTVLSILLVLAMLAFGIYATVVGFKYSWNTRLDLVYVPQEVTLRFEAKVKDNDNNSENDNVFISNAADGAFDNSQWQISQEETTFSRDRQTITINLVFINKCSSDLLIKISGIHYDADKRFSTYLTDEEGTVIDDLLITKNADGTGEYVTTLTGGLDQRVEINLNYSLIETSIPITGEDYDKQYLAISIDLA